MGQNEAIGNGSDKASGLVSLMGRILKMEGEMPLQEMYYIAEMVVGLAVIISIVFVAIELRQNTYLLRRSMQDERQRRQNWYLETICTDTSFREFVLRVGDDYDEMVHEERLRGWALGTRLITPLLNELVAYHDGKISKDELIAVEQNIRRAKRRKHSAAAYEVAKTAFPERVQKYWESIKSTEADVSGPEASAVK
tara:strand:- start:28 stop:615 length:588 start_codon:yes stop_codon:yes gene_type:complete